MNLPECTKVGASAFEDCTAQEIVLKKATDIGGKAFRNCTNLETIYIPQATSFSGCDGCTKLKTVFAPTAKSITTDISSNATIYCTERLTGISFPEEYSDYKCTIVSPEYTAGLAAAIQDGDKDRFIRKNSDDIAESKLCRLYLRQSAESGNIFKEQKSGLFNGSNSSNLEEQRSSCIIKSVSSPCD